MVRLDLNVARAGAGAGVALTGVSAGAVTFEDDVPLEAAAAAEVRMPFSDWPARVTSSAWRRASKAALLPPLNSHLHKRSVHIESRSRHVLSNASFSGFSPEFCVGPFFLRSCQQLGGETTVGQETP